MKKTSLLLLGSLLLAAPVAVHAQFNYTSNGTNITITGYTGPGGAVTIPSTINGLPVAQIANWAFIANYNITSVTIPNGVVLIGMEAFAACVNLTSVTIPSSVGSIGEYAFSNCLKLPAISVDPQNPSYSSVNGVLYDKNQDTLIQCPGGLAGSYAIPGGVTTIEGNAFGGCVDLTSVTIPSSLTSIGSQAFSDCPNLTALTVDPQNPSYSSVNGVLFDESQATLLQYPGGLSGSYAIPSSVTSVADYAFAYDAHLTGVTIPASVTTLGLEAFGYCTGLSSVSLPNSITTIRWEAFSGCSGLTSINIPASVTSIGSPAPGTTAFDDCPSLTAINVDPQNPTYSSVNGVLFDKSQATLLEYPDGLIGSYVIPSSVTTILIDAFSQCTGLAGVTIPASVTVVDAGAFSTCPNLTGIFFQGNAPTAGENVFENNANLTTVYYLPGTTGWEATLSGIPTTLDSTPLSVPVITWATPATITYGTALSSAQLAATANVPGTFVYTPAVGTVLDAGAQTLSVVFTPTDTADYIKGAASRTLTVNMAVPVITWPTPQAITYGTALSSAQLDATANVPGTFVYTPAGGTVLAAGTQTLSVTFTPTDEINYAITTATQTLTVSQTVPVVTWPTPQAITYGTALSSAQLDATANVAGTFVYTSATGTVLSAGTQTLSVTFTPTDSTDYTTATATQTLTVNQAVPVITWAAPAAMIFPTFLSSTQLDATANVPGTFVYTPAAGTLLDPGVQTLSVTFTPTDSTDYTTATATQSVAMGFPAYSAMDIVTNGFTARWSPVNGDKDYRLSVYSNSALTTYVPGFQNLDVGSAIAANVTGLSPNTTYYYQVEAYDSAGNVTSSSTMTVTTSPTIVITTPLIVTTLAGKALTAGNADGTGTAAEFNYPLGIGVASNNAGNLYVADSGNATIRQIQVSNGAVTTIAGNAGSGSISFQNPSSVTVDSSGNIYVADTMNNAIRKITSSGVVTTLAGNPGTAGATDGTGTAAEFDRPQGITTDGSGNLYVADTNNNTIRKIVAATGAVSTLAGSPGATGNSDGTGAFAGFDYPCGVAADAAGNVYVADTENHTIRAITPGGVVTTVAGIATSSGCADGVGKAAHFNSPSALAFDTSSGNLYVADTDNFTIRMVVPSTGVVTTLAGTVGTSGSTDGSGSTALFYAPSGITTDGDGNLYIADTDNQTIRLAIMPAAPAIESQPQSQTVTAGNSASFTVTATGRPAPAYQWYFSGTAINGATSSSYSLSNAQSGNAGNYTVTVSNSAGTVTSNTASLTVNAVIAPPSSGGGGGGGGGAPSSWFFLALLLIGGARATSRLSRFSSLRR